MTTLSCSAMVTLRCHGMPQKHVQYMSLLVIILHEIIFFANIHFVH